ncbi:hypothetical protein L7F22_040163 [Adiantum nelumboides]|nr:hypothetical protein [Adiantum nelumboides]
MNCSPAVVAPDKELIVYRRKRPRLTELNSNPVEKEFNRPVSWFHRRDKSLFPIEVSLGQFGLEDTRDYSSDTRIAIMADRNDDVTEEVSSSQGQQTHEVGESSRPPQTEDEIFRTQLVTAVAMFTQVMQNPRFMAFLQPLPPSQSIGNKKQKSEPAKAQPQVIHTTVSMETPVYLPETMQSPNPVHNVQEQVAETPVLQAAPVQPATFQQPLVGSNGQGSDLQAMQQWLKVQIHLGGHQNLIRGLDGVLSVNVMDAWRLQAPSGFCYGLKFSRFGTHMKRLKDPEGSILPFIDRAARLGQALTGPFLVQLPPNFNLDLDRLKNFLERLPQEYRWAFEFRDTRWLCNEVYTLLRAHNISLCIHDHKDITCIHPKVLTADWVYIRFHRHDYRRRYNRDQLQDYALWIRSQLERGFDVYAYFNNDADGHAPHNALELRELVFEQ